MKVGMSEHGTDFVINNRVDITPAARRIFGNDEISRTGWTGVAKAGGTADTRGPFRSYAKMRAGKQ